MYQDIELDLDHLVRAYEGDVVEEGDKDGQKAKNILDKKNIALNASSQRIRDEVLPSHLQGKFRTEVCRHWLNGVCMKGKKCEFLHQKIKNRMPDCRLGLRCPNIANGKCEYKHLEPDRKCEFYSQGFCQHGRSCKSEHVRLGLDSLPIIGDFASGVTSMRPPQSGKEWYASDAELAKRRYEGPNARYKSAMCKHFMQTGGPDNGGVCPYGDDCHFAHGPQDLRTQEQRLNKIAQDKLSGGSLGSLPEGFALRDDDEPFRLFMLKCNSIQNLARSLQQKVWRVRKDIAPLLNDAFYEGDKVLLLFSQVGTMQVQGCATMLSPIPISSYEETEEEKKGDGGTQDGVGVDNDEMNSHRIDQFFSGHFGVSWDRGEGCMRECSLDHLEDLPNLIQYGVPCSLAGDGQEISPTPEIGGKLLRRLWKLPEPTLDPEDYMAQTALDMEAEARCAKDGGFVFSTPNKLTAGECIERNMAGTSQAMQFEVAFLQKGTPIFLINASTNCIVFGVLITESEYPALIEPEAWVKSSGLPPGATTPAPLQIKFKVALSSKPLRCDDDELMEMMGRNLPLCEGALTAPETARLIEVLARRQYLSNVAAHAKLIAQTMPLVPAIATMPPEVTQDQPPEKRLKTE